MPVTAHTSLQVDAVFTSLRVISNCIIKMGPPSAYTKALTEDNLPYRVLQANQPRILTNTFGKIGPASPGLWHYDGTDRTVWSMGLFGEAFWLTLTRDRLGYPTAVEVLNTAFIDVKADDKGNPLYYYGSGVNRVQLPTEDVIWIPFKAMPGARRGLSSIEYEGIAFALALAAMEYGSRFFAQGASPSMLLSTDAKLGQEEVDRIARKFLIQHSGLQNSHLPLVLDGGMKADKLMSTPDEAQFIATLEYSRMCIASFFGLPSHLVGGLADKGNVWGKTVEEQAIQLEDFTLSGYITPLEEVQSSLLARGQFAAYDQGQIRRANSVDLAAEITALRGTQSATVNDIRTRKLHWAPIEGGDEINTPLASNVDQAASAAIKDADKDDNAGGGNSGGGS